jgi:hypothetical protein
MLEQNVPLLEYRTEKTTERTDKRDGKEIREKGEENELKTRET